MRYLLILSIIVMFCFSACDSTVPEEEIEEPVANTYEVYYMPNGAEGTMTKDVFERDKEYQLKKCTFSWPGKHFDRWIEWQDLNSYPDCATVINLAIAGDGIALYAVFVND